jgi:hypothetical protein
LKEAIRFVKLDKNEVESMLAMSAVIDWNETNEKIACGMRVHCLVAGSVRPV